MLEFKVEKLVGHSKNGIVGKIEVEVGANIKDGDILFHVECDKGNGPIKANCNGIIKELKISEGDNVNLGDVVAIIEGVESNKNSSKSFNYFASMIKPTKRDLQCDVAVIGGGPGGYVAAIYAAKKGLKTVLVEKESLGGTCLNVGCIPTKAIVRSSEVFENINNSVEYGINTKEVSIDMKRVIERKDNIVKNLVGGIDYLLQKNSVEVVNGLGEIIDEHNIIAKGKREEVNINAKNIIIATGSKISNIAIDGFDSEKVINSTKALEMKELPKSMVIIGGGVIGMEFAFIYANFGVEVAVIEYMPKVLPMMDDDVVSEIASIGKEKGIKYFTGSKVTKVQNSEDGKAVVKFEKNGEEKLITCDKVLVAIGREPNIEGLGIDKVGIELNEKKKGIKVDKNLRTNIKNIYAIGDVNNEIGLAHVASHGAFIAVDNILGEDKKMDYSVIPSVVYTTPEVATVGITESEAKEKGLSIKIGKFPFMANGKALTYGEARGFVKVIKDSSTNNLIGASIVGPHGSDLITILTLAIKNNLTEDQIKETIFAHPTTGEAVHEAVLGLEGGAIHFDN